VIGIGGHYFLITVFAGAAAWFLGVDPASLSICLIAIEVALGGFFILVATKKAQRLVNGLTAIILFSWAAYLIGPLATDAFKPSMFFCAKSVMEGQEIFADEVQVFENELCENLSQLSRGADPILEWLGVPYQTEDERPLAVHLIADNHDVFAAHAEPFRLRWTPTAGRHILHREAVLSNGKRIHSPDQVIEVKPHNPIPKITVEKSNIMVRRGRPATIEVLAPLDQEYSYQWRWRKSDDSAGRWITIPSATSPNYTIPEVLHDRTYSCLLRKGSTSRESPIVSVHHFLR